MTYNADFNAIMLENHNAYRAEHGADAMTIDQAAAESAQEWSEYLSSNGLFEHSEERNNCGENLAMSSDAAAMTAGGATKMWYDEITDPGYDFSNPGFASGTGHFTQVVWKGSTKLGCGVSDGYVTCRYCETAGNWMGEFEANVLPKTGGGGGAGTGAMALITGSKFLVVAAIMNFLTFH